MPSELPPPPGAAPVVPAPPSIPPPAGEAIPAPPRSRRRSTALVAGALGLVIALLAGFVVLSGSSPGEARALALSFERGQTERYRVQYTIDMQASSPAGLSVPVTGTMSQTVAWRVLSVDENGVATVELSTTDVKGSVAGQPVTGPVDVRATMQIDPRGRILADSGGEGMGLDGGAQGANALGQFPGAGQITPILPSGAVKPGDTWSDSFKQDLPFGNSLEISTTGEYLRDEEVDGVQAAVIRNRVSIPLDISVDYRDLAGGMTMTGGGGPQGPLSKGLKSLGDVNVEYQGSVEGTITSWTGVEDRRILRADSGYTIDLSMRMRGLPAGPSGPYGPSGSGAAMPSSVAVKGTVQVSVDAL